MVPPTAAPSDPPLSSSPPSTSSATSSASSSSSSSGHVSNSNQPAAPVSTADLPRLGDDTNEPNTSEAESLLRRQIIAIQQNRDIPAKMKAKMIQKLMWQGQRQSNGNVGVLSGPATPVSNDAKEGQIVTFQDEENGILGCEHYQRQCKLQANCCQKIYPCRFCHDDSESHAIVRTDTKFMFCMHCKSLQPAAQTCAGCQKSVATYYCDKCKLWDDDKSKSIFHCDACGICRKGKPEDFFHCHKCNVCMAIAMLNSHRCIERNLESDCPICGEYMFTSTTTVIFMPCGHCIHKECYRDYIQRSYQCPTCLKSLFDMSEYFQRLDRELERQSMPSEYQKFESVIFCNDCEKKSRAKYHFFYHKCKHCDSFNTTVLRTESNTSSASDPADPNAAPPATDDDNDNGHADDRGAPADLALLQQQDTNRDTDAT